MNTCANCRYYQTDGQPAGQGVCFADPPRLMLLPGMPSKADQIKGATQGVALQSMRAVTLGASMACRHWKQAESTPGAH